MSDISGGPATLERLPGFALEADGRGYAIDTPNGRHRFRNVRVGDRTFVSEVFGHLNIGLALEIVSMLRLPPTKVPITDGLKRNISKIDIDPKLVRSMSESRRDEPILMLPGPDGMHVIDGSHRLTRRIRDRCKVVMAHIAPPEAIGQLRITEWRQSDGEWVQISRPTDVELELMIVAAKGMFDRMVANAVRDKPPLKSRIRDLDRRNA